ncbi:hypothetical protein HMPREF1544_01093 [Mucor circinelloides 1006PhL]|uniref:DUF2421 domain-containing protein n=1 Tax=Mucor circinelloides f. circinelloides (strain 1006PhL) TaxID=1220926 RepID=S2JPZ1_MUCC1|nr:hypothetical protein HMPREF1544_01093 [Mucor circinelloides 1006PhL]
MLSLPSSSEGHNKNNNKALGKTLARYVSANPGINVSGSPSSSAPDENFFTPKPSPAPTPSASRNSLMNNLRPVPSTSCRSAFSVQTFHTAIGADDSDDEEQDKQQRLETIVENERLLSNKPKDTIADSSTVGELESIHQYRAIAPPITASNSSNLMIHPMSLVHSTSGSIPNNFYYYGSLDSGMLSRSPAGSYFHDYFSEDYEVVLDDGTRQKRSVSLSTLPVITPLEFGKKKYRGNYNHFYFDEGGDDIDINEHRQRQTSKSQTNEFYHHLLEEEERRALLFPTSSSDPNMIIQDLQPAETSEDEDDFQQDTNRRTRNKRNKRQKKSNRNCFTLSIKAIYEWSVRHVFALSYKQKMVLKCSFAYLLGSLFTFVPILNSMLGTAKISSHVIATVTVFFNPSKTVGGMVEAAGYGLLYTVCALLLSLMSMLIAIYLRSEDYYVTSCCVTLGFWLAGSTFVLSFIKAHYNKPSIGTGCGLGFMIIFPVLVKEGSVIPSDFDPTYIEEMFAIVTIGTAISAFVCWFIWPMTATKKLKTDINDTLMAIKILLKLLTKTFLLDTDLPEFTANENLQSAINSHRTSFTSLQSSLADAKMEYYNLDIWRHAAGYDTIVSSLQRLAQHVGGLRSSCGLQFEVMRTSTSQEKKKSTNYGAIPQRNDTADSNYGRKKKVYHVKATDQRKKMEYELKKEQTLSNQSLLEHGSNRNSEDNDADDDHAGRPLKKQTERQPLNGYYHIEQEEEEEHLTRKQEEDEDGALVQFIKTVRPPMKSLAYTCKQTIVHLQSRFTNQITDTTPSFGLMRQNLAMAMSLFEESQQLALTRMYRRKMKRMKIKNATVNPEELQSHLMNQFPAEDVFLVYFFVFCLLEFAKELMVLVECVQSVFEYDEEQNKKGGFWQTVKRYLISPFWFLCCCFYSRQRHADRHEQEQTQNFAADKKKPAPVITKKSSIESFKPNNNNTFGSLHTPKPTSKLRKFLLNMWAFFSWFRQHTVRYASKSTLIALAIASMAFIPATREYFITWKMDWTLITVMAVMSPTVGGTNQVAVLRVLATILGSVIAVLFYLFLPHQGPILLLMSWAFSIPCFWMILNHKHGRFGMFSLLSYNLIVPFMYNHRNEDEVVDVIELAFMRCATVSAGVIIGLVVTAYIWPFEARKEMRKGLSDLLIRLSWYYKQLVSEYSEDNTLSIAQTKDEANTNYSSLVKKAISEGRTSTDNNSNNRLVTSRQELEALARRNEARSIQFQHVELSLQVSLVELQGLLAYAPNEPRLKGPFPVKTYEAMLTSCQNILDKFLSMRIVILKDVWATQVRRDLMLPASQELMEMAGSVLLYFYLLASALQLKTPLPPYLPPAEKAREMLMLKLQQLPKITADLKKNNSPNSNDSVKDECYMVYYAYVIMMESIIIELDKLGQKMKELFGSLVPDDQWARCFGLVDLEDPQKR